MTQLTVGIPVFNAMPYLRESMESILHQTYSDFVIVAINDGSTDESLEYLKSIRDRRLHVWNQPNRGLTATLNRMLEEAKTPWLVRFDADDIAYPDRLARTIEHIERHPDAGMFYSLADYHPAKSVGQFRSTKGSPKQITELVRSGYLPSICHPTVTLNVDKTKSLGGYRFDLHVEDIDLWWRMALQYDIRLIPEATVGFRQNTQSVSSANLEAQALNTLYVQYLLLSHLWNREPLSYQEARKPLARLGNRGHLDFKAHLRSFNMELGKGNRLRGIWEVGRAILASPQEFSRRVLDEFISSRRIVVGEPVALFRQHQSILWPEATAANLRAVPKTRPLVADSVAVIADETQQAGQSATPPPRIPPFDLLGIRVHAMTKSDLIMCVDRAVKSQAQYIIGNHNLHSIYTWIHDPQMRKFYASADYTHIDGMSLILLGRILGLPLERKHRTGYTDLLPSLVQEAANRGWRLYFLGSKPGVASKAAAQLRRQYPGFQIRTRHGHFNTDRSCGENSEVLAEINAYAPHVLLVGMGMPRQEVWVLENRDQISANAVFCCGALMDYVAGEIPTPPRWLGHLGLEWFCRLLNEPARLSRRYLVEPWSVLGLMTRQYLRYGRKRSAEGEPE
jgi:exopolysaccharide biosynthesis WecB/TagA/CpsF family protein